MACQQSNPSNSEKDYDISAIYECEFTTLFFIGYIPSTTENHVLKQSSQYYVSSHPRLDLPSEVLQ
jgi:hypothetical protein